MTPSRGSYFQNRSHTHCKFPARCTADFTAGVRAANAPTRVQQPRPNTPLGANGDTVMTIYTTSRVTKALPSEQRCRRQRSMSRAPSGPAAKSATTPCQLGHHVHPMPPRDRLLMILKATRSSTAVPKPNNGRPLSAAVTHRAMAFVEANRAA
jgi:hypothetical protein